MGLLHADFLGLDNLLRHDRSVHGAVPAGRPCIPHDLDLRDQRAAARATEGSGPCLTRNSMASWLSSRTRKSLLTLPVTRAVMATACSMPSLRSPSKGSPPFSSCTIVACSGLA